jgi:Tfp pilus assembly protein PilZ
MKKLPKRKSLRFRLPGKKVVFMAHGQLGEGTLANISSGGCAVTATTEQLEIKEDVLIVLELSDTERALELKAVVVRAEEGGFSCRFTELQEDFLKDFPKRLALESRNIAQQQQKELQEELEAYTLQDPDLD